MQCDAASVSAALHRFITTTALEERMASGVVTAHELLSGQPYELKKLVHNGLTSIIKFAGETAKEAVECTVYHFVRERAKLMVSCGP